MIRVILGKYRYRFLNWLKFKDIRLIMDKVCEVIFFLFRM